MSNNYERNYPADTRHVDQVHSINYSLRAVCKDNGIEITNELTCEPLLSATNIGAKESVRFLLALGANPNAPTRNNTLPLHYAAHRGYVEILTLLLDHGAHINAPCVNLDTALSLASDIRTKTEQQEVVRILLERGADPNTPGKNGNYPLHRAASMGYNTIVTLLLDHGAHVNALNPGGRTPIYAAAISQKRDTVQLLLARGADRGQLAPFPEWRY